MFLYCCQATTTVYLLPFCPHYTTNWKKNIQNLNTYKVRSRSSRSDILRMNKLKWNPNQMIALTYSTSSVERINFKAIDFSRNSLQKGEGCVNWENGQSWSKSIHKVWYLCKKGMCPNEMHDDLKPLRMSLLLTAWWRNELLNLGEGRRAWRIMNGLSALKKLLQTKTLSLCTVWSCVTGEEDCVI